MAMVSMTGYGHGQSSGQGLVVEVELSSVNRKQFDLRLNLPRALAVLESDAIKIVRRSVSRGSISGVVRVVSEATAVGGVRVDMARAEAYVSALRRAGKQLDLRDDLSISQLARLPDVVSYDDELNDSDNVRPVFRKALKQAVGQLVAMRRVEGDALEADIRQRFVKLEKVVDRIEKLAPTVPRRYHKNLLERLNEAGLPVDLSDERLLKEIAIFADRCDISEEITRLRSHFVQVEKLMKSREASGRAFDFLCQEFLREINTIGSKANDAKLGRYVISFKAELERVREQIQNVE
jgi:uncharacterized protein (TIGR00255 family)